MPAMTPVTALLTASSHAGLLVQELCPIYESIAWRRWLRYWASARVGVFTSGDVPYVATNDGEQSRRAVDVYLMSLREADRVGSREGTSYVLELGTGCGLFAKLFLDQLRHQSELEGTDDYSRTVYLLCDSSPALLADTRVSGVLRAHEDRVHRVSLTSGELRRDLSKAVPEAVGQIRASHANYVLDSMPFTILSKHRADVFELQIRTYLQTEAVRLGGLEPPIDDPTAFDVWFDQLAAKDEFPGHSALTYAAEYVRADPTRLPYRELLEKPAVDGASQQFVHSFGALACVEQLVELLRPDGYLSCLDYGYDEPWAVLVKAWNGAMTTQDLRNFTGGKRFDAGGSDPFHMELPNSRMNDTDPRVIQCLDVYAKATRFGGSAKNLPYETQKGSQFQKDWLHAYDQKIAKGWKGP